MLILSGAGGNLPESGSRCPQRSGECVRELQTSARRQTGTLPEKTEKAWNRLIPGLSWRRRWDSNPRALADNLISSQARYDHFDTSPDVKLQGKLRKRTPDPCRAGLRIQRSLQRYHRWAIKATRELKSA